MSNLLAGAEYLIKPLIDLGEILPGSTTKAEWDLKVDPSEIVYLRPDCGCTANVRVDGNKIIADYNESDSKKITEEQKNNWYPSGYMPLTKSITAYLKDDKDLHILKDGKQSFNPEKSSIKLTLIGKVKL